MHAQALTRNYSRA